MMKVNWNQDHTNNDGDLTDEKEEHSEAELR